MSEVEHYMERLAQERALADDLYIALHITIKYGRPPQQAADVMARWREARR